MRKRLIATLGASFLLLVGVLGMMVSQAPTSHAANVVHYVRGYSIQGNWLCYGWTRPAIYHCTQHWKWRNGYAYSSTAFVPNGLVGASNRVPSVGSTSGTTLPRVATVANTTGQPCNARVTFPARIGQWTVPSGCYAGIYRPNPAHYVNRPSYGWCNWWPEVLHPAFSGYAALHQPGHAVPRVGAVVHFAPHVQGASAAGHYAQVVAIAPGGYWLLVSEMNFYWRGGGFGRVNYRFIHIGSGVSFRY